MLSDCFYVERELRKRMKIPLFHDDQHGTAITVAAAMLNALKVVGKRTRCATTRHGLRGHPMPINSPW